MELLGQLRRDYHKRICRELVGYRKDPRRPNISDKGSKNSIAFSSGVIEKLGFPVAKRPPVEQTVGSRFTEITRQFIEKSFLSLDHLRPGKWMISATIGKRGIASFDQYDHLAQLQRILSQDQKLRTAFDQGYLVKPDIIVARMPELDEKINKRGKQIVGDANVASCAPLRERNTKKPRPILHASISCKWTMRSDRAQNTRTEALNLIRNRKGNTPHVMFVTFEPLPSRLASIALGTGDLDCTYHVALHELLETVRESKCDSSYVEQLEDLVEGRRIRDISDLPLDLAI